MKTSSLNEEEIKIALKVITFVHRQAKTDVEKSDEFLIQKFGKKAVELAKTFCREMPTKEEIEENTKILIEDIIRKQKKKRNKK